MSTFEEQYLDVLQNMEMAIVSVYREHKDLLDYDVDRVLTLVWTEYRGEEINKKPPLPLLNENARLVYDRLKQICEWRLGRITEGKHKAWKVQPAPLSVSEIMDCLKRIRKSVSLWNKQGGRQGYLHFIDGNLGT